LRRRFAHKRVVFLKAQLRSFEILRGIYLEPEPFTSQNQKLTVSLKPSRTFLSTFYETNLENLYSEIDLKTKNSKTLEKLKDLVQQTLQIENVSENEFFLNIGGDSLTAINLTSLINKTFDTRIPAKILATKNFDEIASYLEYKVDLTGIKDRELPDLDAELSVLNTLKKPELEADNLKNAFLTGASGIYSKISCVYQSEAFWVCFY
jgi:acyl carrier protein